MENEKCSGEGCDIKYIENDPIFTPNLCELCNNYFCYNCMYLTCNICHLSFACFWCGTKNLNFSVVKNNKYSQKCKKHIYTTIVKCEENNCLCKRNTS